MDLLKLLRDRDAGWVRITFAKNYSYELKDVIARVGLPGGPSDLRRISQEQAIDTMTRILWRDLAYRKELIAEEGAHQSALTFVNEYASADAEFYNNLELSGDSSAWFPVSDSTFDLCLLIVNKDSAVCVLAEDDD